MIRPVIFAQTVRYLLNEGFVYSLRFLSINQFDHNDNEFMTIKRLKNFSLKGIWIICHAICCQTLDVSAERMFRNLVITSFWNPDKVLKRRLIRDLAANHKLFFNTLCILISSLTDLSST